jgi:hypothetical protein
MRVQQQVTELAIKGDELLSSFRPVEENPSWATFDEELPPESPPTVPPKAPAATPKAPAAAAKPRQDEHAEPRRQAELSPKSASVSKSVSESVSEQVSAEPHPSGLPGYDELTLPQLRARVRKLSVPQLENLLAYEHEHANRTSFAGMLIRRIGVARQSALEESTPPENSSARSSNSERAGGKNTSGAVDL